MRYDVYINYFKMCARIPPDSEIDGVKSRQFFNFQTILEDINVIQDSASLHARRRIRRFLLTFVSAVVMFVLNWQLSVILLCGAIVSGVLMLLSERKKEAIESLRSEQKTKLERLTSMSFQSDGNTYKRLAADFHHANNKYDDAESKANFIYAFW